MPGTWPDTTKDLEGNLQPLPLLPTTLVGSYPQPVWLVDRKNLAGRFPPRVRAKELWRVKPEFLEQAQDDATLLAIRAQERAGLDIISDGEMRRESYSNRFATALEGVDIDNPGTALDRSGHPNPVPRVAGKVRRRHPVEVRDVKFLRANTGRVVKMTMPGPFTMSQQAQNDFYEDEEEMALDYAAAVNEEIKDLFAAGADIVQIDEPYMQARPEKARQYGLKALNRALDGVTGTTAVHICLPPSSTCGRPAIPSCRSLPTRRCGRCRSRRRNRGLIVRCSPSCPTRRSSSA
jgi:5-methyltetrahydropteroyltriglutamate--homocysteine methyltransferase